MISIQFICCNFMDHRVWNLFYSWASGEKHCTALSFQPNHILSYYHFLALLCYFSIYILNSEGFHHQHRIYSWIKIVTAKIKSSLIFLYFLNSEQLTVGKLNVLMWLLNRLSNQALSINIVWYACVFLCWTMTTTVILLDDT